MSEPTDPLPVRDQVEITIVQAPGCHFCEDAEQAVAQLAERYPIEVRLVDLHGEPGRALVAAHRPAMNPLVLVDGEFFSAGRLPRGRLRRLLDRRTVPAGRAARVG